jgi:hypothetical protein
MQEEAEIESLTQRILQSKQYRDVKSDHEKAKVLTKNIIEIKRKYKDILFHKLLTRK